MIRDRLRRAALVLLDAQDGEEEIDARDWAGLEADNDALVEQVRQHEEDALKAARELARTRELLRISRELTDEWRRESERTSSLAHLYECELQRVRDELARTSGGNGGCC